MALKLPLLRRFSRQNTPEPTPPEPTPHDLIRASGLFSPDWYRARLPEAERNTPDLIAHFLTSGTERCLSPGPLFSTPRYFERYWNLEPGTVCALLHYLRHHTAEALETDGLRDTSVHNDTGPTRPTELRPLPKPWPSLAVTLHVTELTTLKPILQALTLIPCPFVLLVSTTAPLRAATEALLSQIPLNTGTPLVRLAEDGTSPLLPALTTFRNAVRSQALLLALHTSAHTLRTLPRLLPPQPGALTGLLARFSEDPECGIIQPAPDPETPWWTFTWQNTVAPAHSLLTALGIPMPTGYQPHPEHGLFWARTHAIDPLFDLPWNSPGFATTHHLTPENTAGTLARILPLIARTRNCRTDEYVPDAGLIRLGHSRMNLDQYEKQSLPALLQAIDSAETVSFDLFDTLLTRIALTRDTVLRHTACQLSRQFPGLTPPASDFLSLRHQAEHTARAATHGGDVTLSEIYRELETLTGWPADTLTAAKSLELTTDTAILRPRPELITALKHARTRGKRTLLISDTTFTQKDLAPVLEQTGIAALTDELWLSSERRARKDTGALWTLLAREKDTSTLLHIGDGETADMHSTEQAGIRHFHVMSALDLLTLSTAGLPVTGATRPAHLPPGQNPEKHRLSGDILLGPLLSTVFSSPFTSPGTPALTSPRTLPTPHDSGFTFFGPLMLAFMAQIATHPATPGLEKLLFVSREGHFLSRLWNDLRSTYRLPLPEGTHFHCSRRVAISAAQATDFHPDILAISGDGFRGSMAHLLEARLGVTLPAGHPLRDIDVALPENRDTVRNFTLLLKDDILAQARKSRDELLAYAASQGLTPGHPARVALIDVGYSGTIQRHLQTVLRTGFTGFYMAAEKGACAVEETGGTAFGLLASGPDAEAFRHRHGLFVEAILTAPHGQTIGYDTTTNPPRPVFADDPRPEQDFITLEEIFSGITDYAHTVLSAWGPDVFHSLRQTGAAATAPLVAEREGRLIADPQTLAALAVEDNFCGRGNVRFHPEQTPGS